MKRTLTLLLTLLLFISLCSCSSKQNDETISNYNGEIISKTINDKQGEYSGKTVILHSNDTHGAIEGFASIVTCKKDFESKGATVILVDDGDFSQGSLYVSSTKGLDAADLLETAGYDLVTVGNHEFDYGLDVLKNNLSNRPYRVLCSNLKKDGNLLFESDAIIEIGDLRIGFFGLLSPETQTKANPTFVKGLDFAGKENMYEIAQDEIDLLKNESDLVICLSHLGVDVESKGNSSIDLYTNTNGLDFIIDGHSHTEMESGDNGEPIQSTGTEFSSIGVIIIDNKTKKIEQNYLISCELLEPDNDMLDNIHVIINKIDEEYSQIFANSLVDLDGKKEHVRCYETNLGDLITDAMIWYCSDNDLITVPKENILAITNGGGIRASINKGGISKKNVNDVHPFGNSISVVYVTGTELLEVLEASTFESPEPIGGFPQTSGIVYKVNTLKSFNQGKQYPDSTYYAPASIERVTIESVNGKPFDINETYAVITNNFCANGGDTYYALASSFNSGKGFDTGIALDEVVVQYISDKLDGIVSKDYEKAQERIWILVE